MTDTELLDWLQAMGEVGYSPALINDDNGHWAISFNGWQEAPEREAPQDIYTTFIVGADGWHPTVREAIKATMELMETKKRWLRKLNAS